MTTKCIENIVFSRVLGELGKLSVASETKMFSWSFRVKPVWLSVFNGYNSGYKRSLNLEYGAECHLNDNRRIVYLSYPKNLFYQFDTDKDDFSFGFYGPSRLFHSF